MWGGMLFRQGWHTKQREKRKDSPVQLGWREEGRTGTTEGQHIHMLLGTSADQRV